MLFLHCFLKEKMGSLSLSRLSRASRDLWILLGACRYFYADCELLSFGDSESSDYDMGFPFRDLIGNGSGDRHSVSKNGYERGTGLMYPKYERKDNLGGGGCGVEGSIQEAHGAQCESAED